MITRRCARAVVLEKSATTPGRTSNVKTNDPNLRKYFPFMIYPPCSLILKTQDERREFSGAHREIMPITLRSPYKEKPRPPGAAASRAADMRSLSVFFSTFDSDDGAYESCRCKARRYQHLRAIQWLRPSGHRQFRQSRRRRVWYRPPSICHDASAKTVHGDEHNKPAWCEFARLLQPAVRMQKLQISARSITESIEFFSYSPPF